jgi:nitrite reductase (NO-forming)
MDFNRFGSITTGSLALALLLAGTPCARAGGVKGEMEYQIDGKTFGMKTAEVFEEDYAGPAVVGQYLTLAPELAPLPPGNRTHKVRIDAMATEIEIAPDVRFQAWTFGGHSPGPVLHVREGDRVEFTMKNRSAEEVAVTAPVASDDSSFLAALARLDPQRAKPSAYPMPHGIDFHAGMVAMSDKWRSIQPGESIRFQWVANYPGVYIYHCGQPPVFQHMAMGQYGVVVVSPKDGYPTDAQVDHEWVIVQSEYYLKPGPVEGGLYVLDWDAALAKQPTVVAFNGHKSALIDRPLVAKAGDRVRLYVHNIGPTDTSSFHFIGSIFDRIWYEGNPHNEWRGMQTVLLGASNGAVVEFVVPEPGQYAFVDHEFADASKGAVGKLVTNPGPSTAQPEVHSH